MEMNEWQRLSSLLVKIIEDSSQTVAPIERYLNQIRITTTTGVLVSQTTVIQK